MQRMDNKLINLGYSYQKEVPISTDNFWYMIAHEMDARRRMISKNFHHVMRMSERQALTGPPESMREHVVAASKAMKTGNWKECKNYIINEKMNAKVNNYTHTA